MFFSTVGKKSTETPGNVDTTTTTTRQSHATAGGATTTTTTAPFEHNAHTQTVDCHRRQAAERAGKAHEEEIRRVRTLPGSTSAGNAPHSSDSDSQGSTSPRDGSSSPHEPSTQLNQNEHVVWSYQATLALTRRSALFPLCQLYVQLHEFSHLLFFAASPSSAPADSNDPEPPSLAGALWELLLSINSEVVLRIRRAWSDERLARQPPRREGSPGPAMPTTRSRDDETPPLLWLLTTGCELLTVAPTLAPGATASPASKALLQLLETVHEEGPAGVPALLDIAYAALTQAPMRPLTAEELAKRFCGVANDVLRPRVAKLLDLWQVRLPRLLDFMDQAAGTRGGSSQARAPRQREVQVAHAILSLAEGFTITQSTYALFTGTTAPGSDTVAGLMSLLPALNPTSLQGISWANLTNLLHKNNTDSYKLEYVLDTFANALGDVAGTVGPPGSNNSNTATAAGATDAEAPPSLSEALFSLHIVGHKQLHAQRDYVLAFEEIQSTLRKAIELIRVRHVEDGVYLAQTTPYGGADGPLPPATAFAEEGEALLAYLTEQNLLKVNAYLLQKIMKERAPLLLQVLREQHEWYVTGRRPRHWHHDRPARADDGGSDFSKTVYSTCYQPEKGPDGVSGGGATNKYIASKVQQGFQHQFFIMAVCNENIAQCLDKRALVYRCLYQDLLVKRKQGSNTATNNAINIIEGYHLNEGVNPLMSSEDLCTPRQVLQWWQQRTAARLAEEQTRQGAVRSPSPQRVKAGARPAASNKTTRGASGKGLVVDTYMVNDRHKQLYETPEHTNSK